MDALLEALERGHARARWGRTVGLASLVGATAFGLLAWRHHAAEQRQDACTTAGTAIDAVWNADRAATNGRRPNSASHSVTQYEN